MQKSHALPFELTVESVGNWLLSIDQLFPAEKINLFNGVLNELANAPIEKNIVFLILDKLTENILMLSKLLEHIAQRPAHSPDKARKWIIASIQLPKKLSFAFAQLAKDNALPNTQKIVCAYRALQILCLLSKRGSLFYEAPDLSIWKKFAELFLLAETQQWLTLSIDDQVTGLITQPTLESVVKHALLFHSCLPYQYNAADMSAIFATTAEWVPSVRLCTDTSDVSLSHWRPDALLPPEHRDPENDQRRVLSLDNSDLIDFFENHPDKQAKLQAYPGLLNRLTAYYEVRRSVDPLNAKKCGLIIGSAQTAKFLNILISRYRVMELSGNNTNQQKASRLELVPLEIRNTMASLSSKILADVKNVTASQLTIFATKEHAFCVAKIANLQCSQDEPAIIVLEGQPPCFTVIRHIRTDSNIRLRNVLLERIEGEVYPVEIGKHQGFIVIHPESGRAELFLPPDCRHGNTAVLAITHGIIEASLKVEKFRESNAHFARYEVSFC
jgi:hypothetical protein